jgi:hypothetical protein
VDGRGESGARGAVGVGRKGAASRPCKVIVQGVLGVRTGISPAGDCSSNGD